MRIESCGIPTIGGQEEVPKKMSQKSEKSFKLLVSFSARIAIS
jgi:hypothetical protein